MTLFRTQCRKNQCLWSLNGAKISPGLGGVFQLMKKVAWWCSIGRAGDREFQLIEALSNRGAGVEDAKVDRVLLIVKPSVMIV